MNTCYVQQIQCKQNKQYSSIEETDLEWGRGTENMGGADRSTEFVWCCSECMCLGGFSVRSKG